MNIIVDTSVWSLFLRRNQPADDPQVQKLTTILKQSQPVYLLGVILQEILQGISEQAHFDRVRSHFEAFPIIKLEREDYIAAAQLRNECRSHGIQASTIDFQIAAACIRHGCSLLTTDQDFVHISHFSDLELL